MTGEVKGHPAGCCRTRMSASRWISVRRGPTAGRRSPASRRRGRRGDAVG